MTGTTLWDLTVFRLITKGRLAFGQFTGVKVLLLMPTRIYLFVVQLPTILIHSIEQSAKVSSVDQLDIQNRREHILIFGSYWN
jgi:hypothetical protein